ncbi:MAG: PAC2 family protein, partial [Candidatus Omnitrophota bacterium]
MKQQILIKKKPRLKNPVLVAAWPGMGDVALKAAIYLKDKLKAEEFAEISSEEFFHPSGLWIENSLVVEPQQPNGKFYYYKNPGAGSDLVIFTSDAQPFIEKADQYARAIIECAVSLKVKRVYAFAAMPMPIEHTQEPAVH